jgi:hypothetical protein
MLTIHEITGLCQNIYFPAEPYTIATFITVHTALYYLFRDLPLSDMEELNMSRSEVKSMVDICVKNAEVACRNLRLVMDPTYENLQALMMGVSVHSFNSIFCTLLIESLCSLSLPWNCHDPPLDGHSLPPPAGCVKTPVTIGFPLTRPLRTEIRPRKDSSFGLYTPQTGRWH